MPVVQFIAERGLTFRDVKDIFYVFNNILFIKEDRRKGTAENRQGCTALARKSTKPLLWSRTGISPSFENVKQTRRLKN